MLFTILCPHPTCPREEVASLSLGPRSSSEGSSSCPLAISVISLAARSLPPAPLFLPEVLAVRNVLMQKLRETGHGGSKSNQPRSYSEPTPSTWRYLNVSSLEAQQSHLLFTALGCSCQTT